MKPRIREFLCCLWADSFSWRTLCGMEWVSWLVTYVSVVTGVDCVSNSAYCHGRLVLTWDRKRCSANAIVIFWMEQVVHSLLAFFVACKVETRFWCVCYDIAYNLLYPNFKTMKLRYMLNCRVSLPTLWLNRLQNCRWRVCVNTTYW